MDGWMVASLQWEWRKLDELCS